MKLKNKILPIVATASLVATISPLLASCSKEAVIVSKISELAYMYGDDVATTVYFTSSREITNDHVLTLEAESSTLDITAKRNENNNRVIDVTATRKSTESTDIIDELIDLKFTCKDKNNNTIWSATVSKYEFYYSPGATIDPTAKSATCEYDEDTGLSYASYKFDIPEELPENAEVNAELVDVTVSGTLTSTFDVTNATGVLTVYYADGQLGDVAEFSVRLSCKDKTTQKQLVTPSTITGFKLAYNNGVKALSEECFVWDSTNTIIQGLDLTKDQQASSKNTLVLPSKAKSGAATYTIADNAFYSASNTEGTLIPNYITRLKINDEACTSFGAQCFYKAPFTCIDLTQKSSTSAFTNVTFGTSSFKFQSVIDLTAGSMLWKNDDSKEYWTFKHEVKQKLWFEGGLANPQWFEYTAVSTEAELKSVAWHGGNIYLTADIELNNVVSFENTSGIIDLCGFTISSKDGKALYNESANELGLLRFYNSSFIIMDSGKQTADGNVVFSGTIKPATTRTSADKGLAAIQVTTTSGASSNCGLKIIGGKYYGNDTAVYNEGGYVAIQSATYAGQEYMSEFYLLTDSTHYDASKMLYYSGEYATGETGLWHFEITSGKYMANTSGGPMKWFYPFRGRKQTDASVQPGHAESWVPTGYVQIQDSSPSTCLLIKPESK